MVLGSASLYLGKFAEHKQAMYSSAVTSITLGYGNIILSEQRKIFGTFEAMGGLVLLDTSTTFLLGLIRNLFDETSNTNEIKK